MIKMRDDQALGYRVFEPTPQDVRRACEAIQATWSRRTRAKRSRRPQATSWFPPTIRLSDLVETMNGGRADSPL